MAKLYADKIRNGVINPKTGKPWELADVPIKWRAEVERLLSDDDNAHPGLE